MKVLFVLTILVVLCALFTSATRRKELTQEEYEEHAASSRVYTKMRKLALSANHPQLFEEGSNGLQGIDFSQGFSLGTLQCLRNMGFVFSIPRGYQSVGRVDPNIASNVGNSRAAGFEYVDVYMFPHPNGGNARGQFNQLWQAFTDHHLNVGMVWLDVEGTEYWRDANYNIAFMKELLAAAYDIGAKIGIYSSKYQWTSIFGNWAIPAQYDLWYAHYDGMGNCSDFSAFGGFSRPALKQFLGDVVRCGGGVDISTYC